MKQNSLLINKITIILLTTLVALSLNSVIQFDAIYNTNIYSAIKISKEKAASYKNVECLKITNEEKEFIELF